MKPVPLEAARRIKSGNGGGEQIGKDLEALVEFVEQFSEKPFVDMAVEISTIYAGTTNEIRIVEGSVDEETINLIRFNGRIFVPEEIVVEEAD